MHTLDRTEAAHLSITDLAARLGVDLQTGLTFADVARRLESTGPNIAQVERPSVLQILLRQFTSPFLYLLLGAATVSYLLSDTTDTLVIVSFVVINTALGFFQELKSERALQALTKYTRDTGEVYRSGEYRQVDLADIVAGDILILRPGDVVPADVRFIETHHLQVNESAITGEAIPVIKSAEPLLRGGHHTTYDLPCIGFAGTSVSAGSARALVVATGQASESGKVAHLATKVHKVSTFEKQIAAFSRFTLWLVAITLIGLFAFKIVSPSGQSLSELLLFALALAVSVVPEALPVVLTFSLSLGAIRMAKKSVIVKRLSAIQDLGSIEVLCSDKTGTLTENKLRVVDTYGTGAHASHLSFLAAASVYAPHEKTQDPFFEALLAYTRSDVATIQSALITQLPFDPIHRFAGSVIKTKEQDIYEHVAVGAIESHVFTHIPHEFVEWARAKGHLGMRVIVVGSLSAKQNAIDADTFRVPFQFAFAFEDPIKPSTADAIAQAQSLNVQVKILTGDSPEVSRYVAREIGLITSDEQVMTGTEFEALSHTKKKEALERVHVFARFTPAQKYELITRLKEYKSVGFLGEGINDAPALKAAHVSLVVAHASAVARQSADIVLLKKDLKVIIDGVKYGRVVFANTAKYITATLSANFGNFFAMILATLVTSYLPMLPIQLLLVNLLTDMPMVAVATDTVDTDQLAMPSRFDFRSFALLALVLGLVSTIFDFIFFGYFSGSDAPTLQTAWFIGSVLTELVFIYSIRANGFFLSATRPSWALLGLSALVAVVTFILPIWSASQRWFGFDPLTSAIAVPVIMIALCYLICTEGAKLLYMHFAHRSYSEGTHKSS